MKTLPLVYTLVWYVHFYTTHTECLRSGGVSAEGLGSSGANSEPGAFPGRCNALLDLVNTLVPSRIVPKS